MVQAQVGGEHATRRGQGPRREGLLRFQPPHRRHRPLYRVMLLELEEVVLVVLLLVLLRLALCQQLRQRCLQAADRRLEVFRGHGRRRPGAPRCVRRRRLEAGELRQQLRGGSGVRLRGRRLQTCLLRRVRGGKERLEGRDCAGVEAKQRSRLKRRVLLVARGRERAEVRVMKPRGRIIAHRERDGGGPRGDLFLGPLRACRASPRAPSPDLAHSFGADAEPWRNGFALHHRAAPTRALELRAQLEDFERVCGSELARVVPGLAI